jgi:C1A family cysteine protease
MANESFMMNKSLGAACEHVSHLRDYDYEQVCGCVSGAEMYPIKYSIPKENTGTLKDQGQISACVAEVIAQIAEENYRRQFGEGKEMSEGFIYGALRTEGYTGEGMVTSIAMKRWTEIGTVTKEEFDQLVEMPDMKELVTKFPHLYDLAQTFKLKGFTSLAYADRNKRDQCVKDALTKYKYGLVAVSQKYFIGGSHCIMITGWDDEKGKYEFKNSWGEDYGTDGYSYIPKDQINEIYLPLFEDLTLPFTDVKETDWYYKPIKNMYFTGLLKGKTGTTFEPNAPITRAEVATIMERIMSRIDNKLDVINEVLNGKD